MSILSDEDKARIRREEAARLKAIEEERYRAKVRAELEAAAGGAGVSAPAASSRKVAEGESFVWVEPPPEAPTESDRPAVVVPPSEPRARAAVPVIEPQARAVPVVEAKPRALPVVEAKPRARARAPSAAPWWVLAALLLAGGVTLLVFVLFKEGAAPGTAGRREAVELALKATGPFAPIARPPWRPEQLATDEYRIDAEGRVTSVPGRGLDSFEAWKAAFEAPPPVMRELFPERPSLPELELRHGGRPPDPSAPRMRLSGGDAVVATDHGGAAFDGLLRAVPPGAWLVVGVSREGVQRSPALERARVELARQLGAMSPLSVVGGNGLLLSAERLVYAVAIDGVDAEEEFLVGAAIPDSGRVREAALAAGATTIEGAVPWLNLPSGEGIIVEPGRFTATRRGTVGAMLAARASDSVAWAGELSPMLRRVSGASAIFLARRALASDREDLERIAPGLGRAIAFGASVDVGEGITARLYVELADMTDATRLLVELERLRGAATGTPQGPLLERVQAAIDGATLTLTLSLSEHELAVLGGQAGLNP